MRNKSNYPWVLYFTFQFKPIWFRCFWTTRGANFREFVIFYYLHITIGMPWLQCYVESSTDKYRYETNQGNLKNLISFPVGSYVKFNKQQKGKEL